MTGCDPLHSLRMDVDLWKVAQGRKVSVIQVQVQVQSPSQMPGRVAE